MSFFKSITNLAKKVIKPVVGIATGGGSGFDIFDTAKDIYDFAKSNIDSSREPGRPGPVQTIEAPSFLKTTYRPNLRGTTQFSSSGYTEADYIKYITRRTTAYSTLVAAAQSAAGNQVSFGSPTKPTKLVRARSKTPKYKTKLIA